MRVVAISGSYQPKRTIDGLVDEAMRGVLEVEPAASIEKIRLIDRRIEYCRGCMTCLQDDPSKRLADCVIQDDMAGICRLLDDADGYIFACPTYEVTVTAVMKCFLERICWVMARQGRWPMKGCPTPRNPRRKAAVCMTSTGKFSPLVMRLFGSVMRVYKDVIPCSLHARIIGVYYASGVGVPKPVTSERHRAGAFALGRKLGLHLKRL